MARDPNESTIAPVRADGQKGKNEAAKDARPSSKGKNKEDNKAEELSEEDQQFRNELDMLVERLREGNKSLYRPALETLRTLIRTSTSSMTSVPKPLKFLRPHYPELQQLYEKWDDSPEKSLFAEILSVLAMTYSDTGRRETLLYRLVGKSKEDPGLWGHEYVRHLAAEIGEQYAAQTASSTDSSVSKTPGSAEPVTPAPSELPASLRTPPTYDQLLSLALELVPFFLKHNAEPDAVDLLLELEAIQKLADFVDQDTFAKTCLYLVSCVPFLPPPDDTAFLRTAHEIYRRNNRFSEALTLAIRLGEPELIRADFEAPKNKALKQQLAFLLARQQMPLEWFIDEGQELEEDLLSSLTNARLSEHFKAFGKALNVEEPKSLEDVYKSHLENTRVSSAAVDSARANLAGTFVNAFVNAGFGNDKLMVDAEEGNSWIYKNKDHGMMSATASLGLSLLWDADVGLTHVDKYTYSSEEWIKAGAFLATGLLHASIRTEVDAPLALLSEQVENKSVPLKVAAIMGLGYAYAGSQREELLPLLIQHVADETTSMEVASLAALSLGFIYVGSCNGEIASTILQTMMERDDKQLDEKWARFIILGLGLLFLGRQDASDATIETLKAISHPISKQAVILVDICSFAGTSNVLKVQEMLHHCAEHIDTEKDTDLHQAFAVIGVALVAMGEDVGAEMSIRQFNHLMHYGEPVIRKTVPLALGLLSASNPQMQLLDTLSKYSHDNDLSVAINAIFALGVVGAGTNNARLAQMLRQLAGYYAKEPDCLFMVRVAQGLVHMGKGAIGINPFHTDRSLMSRTAVAGLISTLMAFTDTKAFILDKSHWMLYNLVLAMYPRFLVTLDEELNPLKTNVRVGQAVDVVGQAGKPRTISGFQTHETPVRMATNERAELASEQYLSYSHVLENFVILRKNPGWDEEDMKP